MSTGGVYNRRSASTEVHRPVASTSIGSLVPHGLHFSEIPALRSNHHLHRYPEFHGTTLCVTGPRNHGRKPALFEPAFSVKGRIQLIRNRTAPWTVVHSATFDSTMQRQIRLCPGVRFWGPGLSVGRLTPLCDNPTFWPTSVGSFSTSQLGSCLQERHRLGRRYGKPVGGVYTKLYSEQSALERVSLRRRGHR